MKKTQTEFYCKSKTIKTVEMDTIDLTKITLNDFIVMDKQKYVVFTKCWDMDNDTMYVGLETEEDFSNRYKK